MMIRENETAERVKFLRKVLFWYMCQILWSWKARGIKMYKANDETFQTILFHIFLQKIPHNILF
jgi:hypothetical protein